MAPAAQNLERVEMARERMMEMERKMELEMERETETAAGKAVDTVVAAMARLAMMGKSYSTLAQ